MQPGAPAPAGLPQPAVPGQITDDTPVRLVLPHGKKVLLNFMGMAAVWVFLSAIFSFSWVTLGDGRSKVGVTPAGYRVCRRAMCNTVDFDFPRLKKANEPLAALGGVMFPFMILGSLVTMIGLAYLQYARFSHNTYKKVIKGTMIANGITCGLTLFMLGFMFAGWNSSLGKSPDMSPTVWGILVGLGAVAGPITMFIWRKPDVTL